MIGAPHGLQLASPYNPSSCQQLFMKLLNTWHNYTSNTSQKLEEFCNAFEISLDISSNGEQIPLQKCPQAIRREDSQIIHSELFQSGAFATHKVHLFCQAFTMHA